jgi:histone deacetylase 1/2
VFIASKAYTSLFLYNYVGIIFFVLIYVDDIIVTSSSSQPIPALLQDLQASFALNYFGDLHFFLGIEGKHIKDGLCLNEDKYTIDLLAKVGMTKFTSSPTLLSSSEKLVLDEGTPLGSNDITQYRSIVGALQYLTLTRPDISFSVNKVYQFLHAPTTSYWTVATCILRYIKGTLKDRLTF